MNTNGTQGIRFHSGATIPVELHKVRIVQKLHLRPVEERLAAIRKGGLKFVDEPEVLRFFMGRLDAVSDWPERLVKKFKEDFGDSL